MANPIVVIPSRLNSKRLANKPLLDVGGKPMIQRVWEEAKKSGIRTVVACGDKEIFDLIQGLGGEAVLTHPDIPTGTDRIWEALLYADPDKEHDYVINVQGDLPIQNPRLYKLMVNNTKDVCVFMTHVTAEELVNKDAVKVYANMPNCEVLSDKVVTFSREALTLKNMVVGKHVGVYCYTRKALDEFIKTPQTPNEKLYSLEQLRGIESGLDYQVLGIGMQDFMEVNNKEDLEKVRQVLSGKSFMKENKEVFKVLSDK